MGLFGLDNLVGGLLDKVKLGWVMDVVKMYVDFQTGNWLALAGDVSHLVSKFSDFSFMDRVDRDQPLGGFDTNSRFSTNGCFGTTSVDRSEEIFSTAGRSNNYPNFFNAAAINNDHVRMADSLNTRRQSATVDQAV
jgi:hypothetical protein